MFRLEVYKDFMSKVFLVFIMKLYIIRNNILGCGLSKDK